jgi:hypothetical protein
VAFSSRKSHLQSRWKWLHVLWNRSKALSGAALLPTSELENFELWRDDGHLSFALLTNVSI